MGLLDGDTALVTGAASGIGRKAQLIFTSAPPSTGSATPVMKLVSSEARNSGR